MAISSHYSLSLSLYKIRIRRILNVWYLNRNLFKNDNDLVYVYFLLSLTSRLWELDNFPLIFLPSLKISIRKNNNTHYEIQLSFHHTISWQFVRLLSRREKYHYYVWSYQKTQYQFHTFMLKFLQYLF